MSTLPKGWIPFGEATSWLKHHLMVNDSNFVLDHWDCKYVEARIDMRTGAMLLWAGNDRTTGRPQEQARRDKRRLPKMSIVLSCGCKFDDWPERYYSVTTEGTTREGQPCLCYKTVCEACAVDAVFAGEVLELHSLHRTPYDVVSI